jgi:Prophage tail length tape measure protein
MAKLEVEIIGDSRSLEKAFARSSKSAKSFNKDITAVGSKTKSGFSGLTRTVGLLTGGLGVAGLAGAAHAAFSEMEDSQRVAAQTAAVLKSTGSAANVSAKQVDDLAQSLLKKSGIDDETIKSGENLLLTFTNIRNEVGKGNDIFTQATKTATDMSVALGQDMKSSAIQLGKALNDPVKGITALRRVGVSFSKSQIDLIKHLVATGHTMEAQKVILAELHKEFGGSAAAAGKTLGGQLNVLRETLRNVGGEIAQKLAPTITRLLQRMNKWLSSSKNQKQIMDTVNSVVKTLTTGVNILRGAFGLLSKVVGGNTNAIKLLVAAYATWKIAKITSSVAGLASKFLTLGGNAKTAATEARGVGLAMKSLAGIGVITLGVELLIHKDAVDKAVSSFLDKHGLPGGTNRLTRAQANQQFGKLAGTFGLKTAERLTAPARRREPAIVVHGGVHVHGVTNPRELQDAITKNSRGRPVRRRGDP